MKVTKQHIDTWKSKLALKSEPTQETYFVITNKFLEEYEGDISEENLYDFLSTVSKNSIRTVFYALKFFYNCGNIPFNLKVSDVAPSGGVKKQRPILSVEELEALIKTAKLEFGTIEIGYLALSSVYGLRRIEMYNVEADDIDIANKRIRIMPRKRGQEERIHIIPPEIQEQMEDMWYGLKKVKKKPVINSLNMLFDAMCHKAGIELRPRLGWHSIRRLLISELQQVEPAINPIMIRDFIRWKPRAGDIILDYTILDPKKVDERIFKQHPFLKLWSNKRDGKEE